MHLEKSLNAGNASKSLLWCASLQVPLILSPVYGARSWPLKLTRVCVREGGGMLAGSTQTWGY